MVCSSSVLPTSAIVVATKERTDHFAFDGVFNIIILNVHPRQSIPDHNYLNTSAVVTKQNGSAAAQSSAAYSCRPHTKTAP